MKNVMFFLTLFCVAIGGWFVFSFLHSSHTSPIEKSTKPSTITPRMQITSTAFSENTSIPSLYTCDAKGINPPLTFSDVPNDAKSLALIVDDPDAPMGTFVHWVVYNIPVTTTEVEEGNGIPGSETGKNGMGKEAFIGPCPPNGQHRYFFKLYALDTTLSLDPGATKEDVEQAIQGHILSEAQLVGLYKRQ
jgi:Raf kinase inhibitor-like YbhB/YbcL family protein